MSTFLSGGGEMGRRIRELDWGKTPLGPVEGWPAALKSAVAMLLPSKAQIVLFWGPRLVTIYNDAYRPVLGAKHPDALGRPASETWSEIWETGLRELFEGVLSSGEAYWAADRPFVLRRNGFDEETFFDVSYDPVRDEGGKVRGIYCIVTETTGRVLGERRLRTLREISARTATLKSAEAACEAAAAATAANPNDLPFTLVYLLDATGRRAVLSGASGIERQTGTSPATIDLDDASAAWPLDVAVRTGRPIEVGEPRPALVLPLMKPGMGSAAGVLVAGVSPRLPLDDAYRGFFDLLAGHVAAAVASARSFEEEKRRAESLAELDRAKTAFFSNVSHEFRTPLSLMLGPVDDLLAAARELPPAVAGQLEIVQRNGQRLLRLVNALLDFSRIEAGRVRATYQPTDLAAFTADLASAFRAAIERAGLELHVDAVPLGGPVWVDREMWEKIVLNLLSNAFKFTFEGRIEVRLRTEGPHAELTVRDTGTGIPAEEMPRLFERFHRVDGARGRTHEGSGIGLALVQELVRLHGGGIHAQSVLGEGTAFTVTIPLGSAHLPPEQLGGDGTAAAPGPGAAIDVGEALRSLPLGVDAGARTAAPAGTKRPRVLLADDNFDMRSYLYRLLSDRYDVEAVSDGQAAVASAQASPPDLVLTDAMMPRLDGFGVLAELRADPRTRDVPVILLSARAGEESRVEGLQAGADDYLVKPFSARELMATIGAHLEIARVRRESSEALRESEARFRHMADHAPVMVWVTDQDGSCSYRSKSWYDFTGQVPETGLGFGWLDAVHPDDRAAVHDHFLTANARREPFRLEYRLRRRDGEHRWAIDAAAPRLGPDGTMLGYIGSVIDITERKRDELALREADRRKDEFLAMLAHELRGPLAPLRNTLEIMRRTGDDRATLPQARAMMERQLSQLQRLVDDLLDVNRITRGSFELRKERVDLAPVLHHAVESCRPLIDSYGHHVTVTVPAEPVHLDADPVRLLQILGNVVHNACKFTDPGGSISVAARRDGDEVVVSVKDTGVGMRPDQIPKIFEMFMQLEHTVDRAQGGLGIGLALAKRLVEMHAGTVEARSEGPGLGTEILVRLPALPARKEASPRSAASPEPGRHRFLVVDDNPDSSGPLERLLQAGGYEAHVARDGLEAVGAAERHRPDVILLDIGLPRLNGYDACRLIREQAWGINMVLIAMTGWGQEEDRRRSRDAGFDGHLVKPVEIEELMKLLDTLPGKPARATG